MIERQVAQMARLIDDLLDVSRMAGGQLQLRKELLDLVALVRSAVGDYRAGAGAAGLSLSLELPERPVRVVGDATRLAQVVGHVVHNAIKFTGAGGQVAVRLAAESDRGWAVLTVRDTGVGMDPDMLAQAFETFTRADPGPERGRVGLGLGLPLVRGLVELHGGDIGAASEGRGRGTEVTIRLPLNADHAVPVAR
jgi:signal transduction histidine kinase